jgi:signal transduction histidine kinase/CheY-like chemotaxis protein
MYALLKKLIKTINLYAQVLLVWTAFALMVIVSYIFVGNIVRKHLLYETMEALNSSEIQIEADLMEPQTLMGSVSETIRSMLLLGYSQDMVTKYMAVISNNIIRNENRKLSSTGIYGFFDVFGNKLIDLEWTPPEGYVPQERPWYQAAVAAEGRIAVTPPYLDMRTGNLTIAFVKRIFDDDNNPLAVLSMNVSLNKISEYIVKTHLAEGGYGLLLSKNLEVIAHPHKEKLGMPLRDWSSGLAGLAFELEAGVKYIGERKLENYRGDVSIVSFRRLGNGWYIGIVTPYNKYYQDVNNMMLLFVILGVTLSAILSVILWRIAASKKKVDEESRQKSDFLAKMSHEIRTPMNAILGITEIQLQDRSLREDLREALGKIYNSGDLLLGIINDILDFSKIEAGKMELVPVKYYISSMINDVVQLNKIKNENKPIDFKLKVDEFLPAELFGDELRIKQILNNLLSNAFKYTEKGEVLLSVSVEQTRVVSTNATIIFKVCDTGQGMTQDQIHKIFDEYSRFNLEANRTTQGTGLGMSITRNLVYMMEGTISVDSSPGEGTVITVKLPQRIESSAAPIGKETAEALQQFKMSSASQTEKSQIIYDPMPYGSVLVVDDVETNLYVAKGLLSPYELAIDTAVSGFETIDKVKAGGVYDIIFMDHMMPKMDGIETTKILRETGYNKPIIALTANALVGQAEMFMRNGFDGFISKPIDVRQLNTTLNKMVRDKQPYEVIDAARQQRAAKLAHEKTAPADSPLTAETFVRDAKRTIATLELIFKNEFRRTNDINIFGITVHSMREALENIEEIELSNEAQKLEQAVHKRNFALIITETTAFISALRKVCDKMSRKAGIEPEDEDLAFLNEKLRIVRKACEEHDKQTAKNILVELKHKTWSRLTKDLLNTVIEYVLKDNFDEAANLLKDYNDA